jgi:hypothetical protein
MLLKYNNSFIGGLHMGNWEIGKLGKIILILIFNSLAFADGIPSKVILDSDIQIKNSGLDKKYSKGVLNDEQLQEIAINEVVDLPGQNHCLHAMTENLSDFINGSKIDRLKGLQSDISEKNKKVFLDALNSTRARWDIHLRQNKIYPGAPLEISSVELILPIKSVSYEVKIPIKLTKKICPLGVHPVKPDEHYAFNIDYLSAIGSVNTKIMGFRDALIQGNQKSQVKTTSEGAR